MDPNSESTGGTSPASVKRRKLRKGTRSCWECKRRKIRCMFVAPGDATCVGCQHRHVSCVSQEHAEDPVLARRSMARGDWLHAFLAGRPQTEPTGPRGLASPSASWHDSPALSLPSPAGGITPETPEADTAALHLFAALPTGADLQILLRESARPSRYTHLVNTQPHRKWTLASLAAPYPATQLPRPDTHPVLLARLLLLLAITLQSPSGEQAEGLSEAPEVLMPRLVSAARTWVMSKEEMHGSLECLLCIVLEGVYETNGGNLRRAWAAFRRAMTVAQLMGLHGTPQPRPPRLDPGLDVDARFLWFRIVSMDRYLSLLLGLPQGSADATLADAAALQDEPPLGQFERLLAVVACRVLQRNETAFAPEQLAATRAMDAELLRVSRRMPARFWQAPNFHNARPGSPETLLETVRLAAHVYYYGLLIQLHLPYMLRSGDRAAQTYASSTSVNASREILTRFMAHRTFNPSSSCSRPVDFFALLAAMTLLLAHLDAHRHSETPSVLAHQRLSDRAMLVEALERMDVIKNLNQDPVTGKSAALIRQLMDMEADAAAGGTYATSSADDDGGDHEDNESDAADLRLPIPYLGVIRISRQGPISRDLWTGRSLSGTPAAAWCGDQSAMLPCPPSPAAFPPLVAGVDDWTLQGVDMAFFDSLMRGS